MFNCLIKNGENRLMWMTSVIWKYNYAKFLDGLCSINWTISIFLLILMIFSIYFLLFSGEHGSNKSYAGFSLCSSNSVRLYPTFCPNLSYLSCKNKVSLAETHKHSSLTISLLIHLCFSNLVVYKNGNWLLYSYVH